MNRIITTINEWIEYIKINEERTVVPNEILELMKMYRQKKEEASVLSGDIRAIKADLDANHKDKVFAVLDKIHSESITVDNMLLERIKTVEDVAKLQPALLRDVVEGVDGKRIIEAITKFGEASVQLALKEAEIIKQIIDENTIVTTKPTLSDRKDTKKNKPAHGTILAQNESIGSFFNRLFEKINLWFNSFMRKFRGIKDEFNQAFAVFDTITEAKTINEENDVESDVKNTMIYKWLNLGRKYHGKHSGYKINILQKLMRTENPTMKTFENNGEFSQKNLIVYVNELRSMGIIVREKLDAKFKPYVYKITESGAKELRLAGYNVYQNMTDNTEQFKVDATKYDYGYLEDALIETRNYIAKWIERHEKSIKYNAIISENDKIEEKLIELLEEAGITQFRFEDRIITVTNKVTKTVDGPAIQNKLRIADGLDAMVKKNLQKVADGFSKSTQSEYITVHEDPGGQTGELGRRFDHKDLTVKGANEGKINEEKLFSRFFNWVKNAIASLLNLNKTVETELAKLD